MLMQTVGTGAVAMATIPDITTGGCRKVAGNCCSTWRDPIILLSAIAAGGFTWFFDGIGMAAPVLGYLLLMIWGCRQSHKLLKKPQSRRSPKAWIGPVLFMLVSFF